MKRTYCDRAARTVSPFPLPGEETEHRTVIVRAVLGEAIALGLVALVLTATSAGADFGEAYTQPVRLIHVATGESGRTAAVNVAEGDRVSEGDVLLKLDTSVLEASRRIAVADVESTAAIKALKVEYRLAARRHQSLEEIAAKGGSSSEELWRAEATRFIAICRLNEAKEQQRKNQLRLEEIDTHIRAHSVISPMDGVVVDVHYDVGELIPANEPKVITVVDLSALRATFYIPTSAALSLKKQDSVLLKLENGKNVKGEIEYVGVVTEYESGRVRVKVLIENAGGIVRSGMRCEFANESQFQVGSAKDTTKMP